MTSPQSSSSSASNATPQNLHPSTLRAKSDAAAAQVKHTGKPMASAHNVSAAENANAGAAQQKNKTPSPTSHAGQRAAVRGVIEEQLPSLSGCLVRLTLAPLQRRKHAPTTHLFVQVETQSDSHARKQPSLMHELQFWPRFNCKKAQSLLVIRAPRISTTSSPSPPLPARKRALCLQSLFA